MRTIQHVEVFFSDKIFETFFSIGSSQITYSNSVFHADSEYDTLKKFKKINVLEISSFLYKKRNIVVYATFSVIQLF